MKLIKLTNASTDHQGNYLYLHENWIVSVFQIPREPGGSLFTVIYGGPLGISWNVEESPEEIKNLMRLPQ